jgi:hypothetical protein
MGGQPRKGASKGASRGNAKQFSAAPKSGRYSRSEGAGPGPKRKHANSPPGKK